MYFIKLSPFYCLYRVPVGTKDGAAVPGFGRGDSENEDRLAHILSEASHMMKNSNVASNNDDSRSNEDSSSPRTQCQSPFSNKVR